MIKEGKGIVCPYCGSTSKNRPIDGYYKCEYCENIYYENVQDLDIDFREARNEMKLYNFTEADERYLNIFKDHGLNNDKVKLMALWGELLAQFGVVYIRSFDSKYFVPTFSKYRKEFGSIMDSNFYKNIKSLNLNNLNEIDKKAKELDKNYKRIKENLESTPEYDVFLCTKISKATESNPSLEGYAIDKKYAEEIKEKLEKEGMKVFYSKTSLSGINTDAQIYSALLKSKTILVVGTCYEHLTSAWVQSEWRRWLNFIDNGLRDEKTIFLYLPKYKKGDSVPDVLEKGINRLGSTQKWNEHQKDQMIERMIEVINPKQDDIIPKKGVERLTINPIKIDNNISFDNIKLRKVGNIVKSKKKTNEDILKDKLNLAKSKFNIGKYEEAQKIYEEVIELDANNNEAVKHRFLCQLKIQDFDSIKGNRFGYISRLLLNQLLENLDEQNALEILETLSNNIIKSINEEKLFNKNSKIYSFNCDIFVDFVDVILSYDFSKRDELINVLKEYALRSNIFILFDSLSKHMGFKELNQYVDYYRVKSEDKDFEFSCKNKIFDINPSDKENSRVVISDYIENINKNSLLNNLDYFRDYYFLTYLSLLQYEKEKIEFINFVLLKLEDVIIYLGDSRLISANILLWIYENIFRYYPESYDYRKDLNNLFERLPLEEKYEDVKKVGDIFIKEYQSVNDIESSKYIINTACRIIDYKFNNKLSYYMYTNDFDTFISKIEERELFNINYDEINIYVKYIMNSYILFSHEFANNREYTNKYAFALDFIPNLKRIILKKNKDKNKEIRKMVGKKSITILINAFFLILSIVGSLFISQGIFKDIDNIFSVIIFIEIIFLLFAFIKSLFPGKENSKEKIVNPFRTLSIISCILFCATLIIYGHLYAVWWLYWFIGLGFLLLFTLIQMLFWKIYGEEKGFSYYLIIVCLLSSISMAALIGIIVLAIIWIWWIVLLIAGAVLYIVFHSFEEKGCYIGLAILSIISLIITIYFMINWNLWAFGIYIIFELIIILITGGILNENYNLEDNFVLCMKAYYICLLLAGSIIFAVNFSWTIAILLFGVSLYILLQFFDDYNPLIGLCMFMIFGIIYSLLMLFLPKDIFLGDMFVNDEYYDKSSCIILYSILVLLNFVFPLITAGVIDFKGIEFIEEDKGVFIDGIFSLVSIHALASIIWSAVDGQWKLVIILVGISYYVFSMILSRTLEYSKGVIYGLIPFEAITLFIMIYYICFWSWWSLLIGIFIMLVALLLSGWIYNLVDKDN